MSRAKLSSACAIVLCLLSAAWIYVSFSTRLKAEMTMRRQLQSFEQRLRSTVRASPSELRMFLTQTGVITENSREVVILGAEPQETFEEMRIRITTPLLFPMWPGVVSLAFGFVCILVFMFSANAPKNA